MEMNTCKMVILIQKPGPHLSEGHVGTELELFSLYISDDVRSGTLVEATNSYAVENKATKPAMYRRYKQHILIKEEIFRYIGDLLIRSINSLKNYHLAWNTAFRSAATT